MNATVKHPETAQIPALWRVRRLVRTLSLTTLGLLLGAFLSAYGERVYVMEDENGNYYPTNALVTAGQVAQARAEIVVASNRTVAVQQAASNCTEIVNETIEALVGNSTVVYVTGYVESLGGVVQVNTNDCAATIFGFDKDYTGPQTKNGVACMGHRVYFSYPADVSQAIAPSILYAYNLGGTNQWLSAEQDNPVGPSTVWYNGTQYENAYYSIAWLPQSLSHAFFKVMTEIESGGTGTTLNIEGGAKGYYTGVIRITNPTDIYVCGGFITNWVEVANQ